jgi:hypothetical protein
MEKRRRFNRPLGPRHYLNPSSTFGRCLCACGEVKEVDTRTSAAPGNGKAAFGCVDAVQAVLAETRRSLSKRALFFLMAII